MRKLIIDKRIGSLNNIVTIKVESDACLEIDFADAVDCPSDSRLNFVSEDTEDKKTGIKSDTFECDSCQKKFHSKKKLERHFSSGTCPKSRLKRHVIQVRSINELLCHLCDKKFARKDQLSRHLTEHLIEIIENGPSPDVHVDQLLKTVSKLVEYKSSGQYQCQICKRMLKARRSLLAHYQVHLGIKYQCKSCEKQYNRKYSVAEHMRIDHGIETREVPEMVLTFPDKKRDVYSCEKCEKAFSNKYKLRTHVKEMHSDLPPILCGKCGQSFKTKVDL